MGTPAKSKKKIDYPVHEMKEKGRLVIPPEIISQIQFLHSYCGTDEWSGMLLYDVVSGNPSDPENFELKVKHIFLMDIGSAAATEYEPDGDIVDIFDNIPEAMEWKIGHIHTHHSGSTYFSAVDTGELQDNVDKHNYYLSLVVNFNGNYSAKVVFLSEVETKSKMNYLDDSGKTVNFTKADKETHMVSIDMRIFYSGLSDFFTDRLHDVKKEKEKAKKRIKSFTGYNHSGYNVYGQRHLPAHNQRAVGSKVIPEKMTSWEIEKLTRNVLGITPDLTTEENVYILLHQLRKEETAIDLSLYSEYLMNNIEDVINNYFDDPLDDDEMVIILNEIIMCVSKYETHSVLSDIVEMINGVINMVAQGYIEGSDVDTEENDIATKLAKAEEELQND